MHYETLPFELGQTLSGADAAGNLKNAEVLGKIFQVPYQNLSVAQIGADLARKTSRPLTVVALRNLSAITLHGKRVAQLKATAGFSLLEAVSGYAASLAQKNVVFIDPFLPSSGVIVNDIFWGVLSGPTTVLTSFVGADFNGDIAVGAQLVANTGSTSGNSANGRVSNVTLPGQTGATAAFNFASNLIAVALSARTTGETNSDLLVNACIRH